MPVRVCRFLALLSGALALTMTSAHLLELPQKLGFSFLVASVLMETPLTGESGTTFGARP